MQADSASGDISSTLARAARGTDSATPCHVSVGPASYVTPLY